MFHRCYECPALQAERDMHVSQEVRQAARSLGSQTQGTAVHTAFFLTLPPFCQQVLSNVHALFCGTIGSQTGFWRGNIFTDGSSSGNGTLRRTGWAVVAVDNAGNLKAGAYGAVPSDVLPGQTSRDGEDCAAAMAGHITSGSAHAPHRLRRMPLLQSMGQSAKPWAPGAPEHTSGTGFWFPTTRSGQSRSRSTPRSATWRLERTSHLSKRGNDYADTFAKKGDKHTQACFSGRQDSRCVCLPGQASCAMGGRGIASCFRFRGWRRHQGCRAKNDGYMASAASEVQAQAAEGGCCAIYRSGFRLAFPHRSHTLFAR